MFVNLENKRVAFYTLGCKVNQYETDSMMDILKSYGCVVVPFKDKADIYIINTCSVTNMADRKSRQIIHRAKKSSKDSVVVAVGCQVFWLSFLVSFPKTERKTTTQWHL